MRKMIGLAKKTHQVKYYFKICTVSRDLPVCLHFYGFVRNAIKFQQTHSEM